MIISRKIRSILSTTIATAALAIPAQASATECRALTQREVRIGEKRATREQTRVVNVMLQESTKLRASFRVQVSILAASMQESGARELPYGHGTSVGPLQLISIHGPAHLRQRADYSAKWYLPQAMRMDRGNITIAEMAVRIQRPADRRGYKQAINNQWKTSALHNVRSYRKACRS